MRAFGLRPASCESSQRALSACSGKPCATAGSPAESSAVSTPSAVRPRLLLPRRKTRSRGRRLCSRLHHRRGRRAPTAPGIPGHNLRSPRRRPRRDRPTSSPRPNRQGPRNPRPQGGRGSDRRSGVRAPSTLARARERVSAQRRGEGARGEDHEPARGGSLAVVSTFTSPYISK